MDGLGAPRDEEEPLDASSRVVIAASERLLPSVAHLRSGRGGGSGVVITPDGFVVPSAHVVERARRVRVSFVDGSEYRAEVAGRDPLSDLAVLRAEANRLVPAELRDAGGLRIGQLVVAVGNPNALMGLGPSGGVSALRRSPPHPPRP